MQNVQNDISYQKLAKAIEAMETVLGVTKAREKLSEIVESVQYQNDAYIISRHGRPRRPSCRLKSMNHGSDNERNFALIAQFQEASGEADPDEVMKDVLEAQQAVRRQQKGQPAMRAVLDANVYVSSIVNTKGNPNWIISAWNGAFDVLISSPILDEIGRVLRYPRIARRHQQDEGAIQRFLRLLQNEAILVGRTELLSVVKEDESDNRYLECAVAGKAGYLISGDKHLLDIGDYRGIIILPAAAFVALLGSGGVMTSGVEVSNTVNQHASAGISPPIYT